MKTENLVRKRCPYCGGFLSDYPFYSLFRTIGEYKVWVCPKCKKEIKEWTIF